MSEFHEPMTEEDVKRAEEMASALVGMGYGEWGFYGFKETACIPTRGALEAAPGLSVGTTGHTEPIARFNGYALPVELTAGFVAHCDPAFVLKLLSEVRRLQDDVTYWRSRACVFEGDSGKSAAELEERIRALEGALNAYETAIDIVRDWYPEDVFLPGSNSPDAKAAKMARATCDNIREEAAALSPVEALREEEGEG